VPANPYFAWWKSLVVLFRARSPGNELRFMADPRFLKEARFRGKARARWFRESYDE
jgi:hypothetical protein